MTFPFDTEQLLRQTEWLRELSRQLLRDPQAADDVVQETWLAALQSPPPDASSLAGLRAWLNRVLRNFARMRLRADSRRRRREELTARGEAVPSVAESVERVAVQREIVDAVLALEPQDREVVVLRYFEGLTPRMIAERLRVSNAAVRSRLSRALSVLRARLERRFGGDRSSCRAALSSLACVRAGRVTATVVLGGLAMKKLSAWVVGMVLLALGVLVATMEWGGEPDMPGAGAGTTTDNVRGGEALGPGAVTSPAGEGERVELSAVDPARQESPNPATGRSNDRKLIIIARCLDPAGAPVAGAQMTATHIRNRPAVASGADGRVRLELSWPMDLTMGNRSWAHVEFTGPGWSRVQRQERIKGPETVQLGDVMLRPGGAVHGVVRDASGSPLAGAFVSVVAGVTPGSPEVEEARKVRGPGQAFKGVVYQFSLTGRTDEKGSYRIAGVPVASISIVAWAPGCYQSYTPPVVVRHKDDVAAADISLRRVADKHTIRGIVLDQQGEPLPRARVEAFVNHGARNVNSIASARAKTDARFELIVPSNRMYTLCIRHPRKRMRSLVLHDVAAGTQRLKVRFPGLRTIEITAVDPLGARLRKPWVQTTTLKNYGLRVQSALREDGVRVLDVPDQPFKLSVRVKGYRSRWYGPFEPATAPRKIEAQLQELATVSGQVLAGGRAVAGARVHLHRFPRHPGLVHYLGRDLYSRLSGLEGRPLVVLTDASGHYEMPIHAACKVVVHAEAKGFARAESRTLELHPDRSMRGIDLRLVAGGTIEGRVRVATGLRAKGTLVAATRGDGHVLVQMVGDDGSFRFTSLTPGGWQIKRCEPEQRRWLVDVGRTLSEGELTELPVQVRVHDGRTSRFDLDFTGERPATLRVSLSFDGMPAVRWQARLWTMFHRTPGTTDRNGVVELGVKRHGSWALVLTSAPRSDGELRIVRHVDLKPGENRLALAFATGRVDITGMRPPSGAPGHALVWKQKAKGDRCSFVFDPDSEGRLQAEGLPAGRVELRRRAKGSEAAQVDGWALLGSFEILAGKTARFACR